MELISILPAGFGMALAAIRAISAFVNIFMTSRTVESVDFGKLILAFAMEGLDPIAFTRRNVTLPAVDLTVLAPNREVGAVVVKRLAFLERLSRVTLETRTIKEASLEHIFVFVHMTVIAKAFLSSREDVLVAPLGWFGRKHETGWLVAFFAGRANFFVPAGQLEACYIMIKGF